MYLVCDPAHMRCEQQSDGGPCRRVSSTPPLLPMCNGCSTTKSKFIACGAAVGVCQHQCGVKYWRSPSLREQPQKLCLKDYALRLSRFGSPGTIRTNTWDLAERGALLLQPSGADRRSVYVSPTYEVVTFFNTKIPRLSDAVSWREADRG